MPAVPWGLARFYPLKRLSSAGPALRLSWRRTPRSTMGFREAEFVRRGRSMDTSPRSLLVRCIGQTAEPQARLRRI
jgi:hypothetical protein